MNAKINAAKINALKLVANGEVTYAYRSAPKIKGTRLVKAVSSEYLNKKIARGVTDSMLAKLFAADLVTTEHRRNSYGTYQVALSATGRDVLANAEGAMNTPLAPMTATLAEVVATVKGLIEIVNDLLAAAKNARTEAAQAALYTAAGLVERGELAEARKVLAPLRTRAARAAIAAIKAL